MKIIIILFSILAIFSCGREENDPATQNISLQVRPIETDNNYSSNDKSHYIVRNSQVHLNKLLLFIGGTFSTPKNYNVICDHGASIGFDVISISYPDNVPAAPLGSSSDRLIFDNYRDEICFGNPKSDEVDVNILNSINTRTVNLLEYLDQEYPDQNWNQYLTSTSTLQWDKIVVSGHSQGSGHACYFGKKNLVEKVVMFSGPNDYSTFYSEPANWIRQSGATPLNKQFSLLHIQDQIVPFSNQVAILRGLGLLSATDSPVLVDHLTPPYANANSLSINISAISNHNSTIGRNPILPEIWTYMFK